MVGGAVGAGAGAAGATVVADAMLAAGVGAGATVVVVAVVLAALVVEGVDHAVTLRGGGASPTPPSRENDQPSTVPWPGVRAAAPTSL